MKLLKLFIATAILFSTTVFAQVNINTASVAELTALKGIGEKKAAAIIKYRKSHGKFKTTADLINVDGVGETVIKNLGSDIRTSGATDLSKIKNKASGAVKQKATSKPKPSKKATDKKPADKKSTDKKATDKKTTDKKTADKKTSDKKTKSSDSGKKATKSSSKKEKKGSEKKKPKNTNKKKTDKE